MRHQRRLTSRVVSEYECSGNGDGAGHVSAEEAKIIPDMRAKRDAGD